VTGVVERRVPSEDLVPVSALGLPGRERLVDRGVVDLVELPVRMGIVVEQSGDLLLLDGLAPPAPLDISAVPDEAEQRQRGGRDGPDPQLLVREPLALNRNVSRW
jgi:hypothetical protein